MYDKETQVWTNTLMMTTPLHLAVRIRSLNITQYLLSVLPHPQDALGTLNSLGMTPADVALADSGLSPSKRLQILSLFTG